MQRITLTKNAADSLPLDIAFRRRGNRREVDKTIRKELHSYNVVILSTPLSAQKSVWTDADLGIPQATFTYQEKGQVSQRLHQHRRLVRVIVGERFQVTEAVRSLVEAYESQPCNDLLVLSYLCDHLMTYSRFHFAEALRRLCYQPAAVDQPYCNLTGQTMLLCAFLSVDTVRIA